MEKNRSGPKVGLGVIVVKDGKVLFGKRKSAHGFGTWCPPGGHLEYGETPEEGARREVREESGIEITNIQRGSFTNDLHEEEGKHYITLIMVSDWASGEPTVKEPGKCEEWNWFEWNALPRPLFLSIQNLLKQGFNPFKK